MKELKASAKCNIALCRNLTAVIFKPSISLSLIRRRYHTNLNKKRKLTSAMAGIATLLTINRILLKLFSHFMALQEIILNGLVLKSKWGKDIVG